jgi:predicted transcriptional regulator
MKKLVSVRLDARLLRRLRELAKRDERTVSWLINKAVAAFVGSTKGNTRGK